MLGGPGGVWTGTQEGEYGLPVHLLGQGLGRCSSSQQHLGPQLLMSPTDYVGWRGTQPGALREVTLLPTACEYMGPGPRALTELAAPALCSPRRSRTATRAHLQGRLSWKPWLFAGGQKQSATDGNAVGISPAARSAACSPGLI